MIPVRAGFTGFATWHAVRALCDPALYSGTRLGRCRATILRGSGMRERLARRLFPLLASAGLIAVGMSATTWVTVLIHLKEWALPYDIWGTMIAATRLVHGQIGGIYAQPTGLVSLPGTAGILLPPGGGTPTGRPSRRGFGHAE